MGQSWVSPPPPGAARCSRYHYLLDADRPLAADAVGLAAPMLNHANGMAADPAVLRAASVIMSAVACAARCAVSGSTLV
jgi:hypothetical protein